MSKVVLPPLPEPVAWQVSRNDHGLWASQYWEECSEWEAQNCVAAADLRQLYTAENLHAHAAAVSAAKDKRIKVLEDALTKIDAIRNDIIGRQKIGWSSHVYPLVAALDEAGYPGMEYEIARAALGDKT